METEKQNELQNEAVREIMGTPPGWLLRRGTLLITLVLLLLLLFSWFFRYPDLIRGRIVVLSENPPVTVAARATGKLDHLFVADQQRVEAGQLLGIIENPASHTDVYRLQQLLDPVALPEGPSGPDRGFAFPEGLLLGQIQPFYTAFMVQAEETATFLRYDLVGRKIESLRRQGAGLEGYLLQLTRRERILQDQLLISRRQYTRDSLLFRQSAIPETELEKSRSALLEQELNHRAAVAGITETQLEISRNQREISELSAERSEQQNLLLSKTREKQENLLNEIRRWEQDFVLKSPLEGTVTLPGVWKAHQQVRQGEPVFYVVPAGAARQLGRLRLPVKGSGKVHPGQQVTIRLDNYPYLEYGVLRGKVEGISLVPVVTPDGTFYTAEVTLVRGLETNYGITLPFSEEMQGDAEVITNDRRLLERLFAPLVALFRERIAIV